MSFDDFEHIDKIQNELRLNQAKKLLKEALQFMNLVPNNMITVDGEIVDEDTDYSVIETINHYELCSKIDEFLKKE
jgi:hypothetical protein